MPKTTVTTASKNVDMLRNVLAVVAFISAAILLADFYSYIDFTSVITQTNLQWVLAVAGMVWAVPELLIYRKLDGMFNLMALGSGLTAFAVMIFTWQSIGLHVYIIWGFVITTGLAFFGEMLDSN